jgi:GH35 family endo-1,4-beta-xylanase/uncharacterized protein YjdB
MRKLLAHARPSSALFAILIIACAGGESRLVDPRPDTSNRQYTVRLTTELDSLPFGESRLYVARVTNAAGAEQTVPVVWASTDPQVLTVGAGTATAIGFGSAGLVARYANSADTATIVVSAAGLSLQVSPSAIAATLGDTLDFQARLVGPGGSSAAVQNVRWSLTDSSAATFVGDARVTTVREGEFDVVADVGGKTATASVKITQPSVSSISIDPPVASIDVGESVDLNASVRDQRGHVIRAAPVSWNVSDGSVATVDALGIVRGVSRGGVIVTATSGTKTATSTVTVAPRPAASVTLTIDPATIVVGSRLQAVAVPRDAQGQPIDGRPVAYQSGNPAVATVTNTGLVGAVASGVTTISVICDGHVATVALTVQTQRVASVAIVPSAQVVMRGTTATLAAGVLDQMGQTIPNAVVTWSSWSPAIVAVSSSGVVTGVALGSSQVSATASGVTGTAIVTVNAEPISSVVVAPSTLSLQVGQSGALSASAFTLAGGPLSGTSFTWTSSNSAVATVSPLGLILAKAAGNATITATSGGKSSSASVTVSPVAAVPVASIRVATGTSSLAVGQTTQATATLTDVQGNVLIGRTVTWSSADTTVLKVSSSGLVAAVAAGTVAISAFSEGRTGFAAVAVTAPRPAAVASVSVSAPSSSLLVGQTSQLMVVLRDVAGDALTGRTILYTTSNTSVATVSASGLVTARAGGAATIMVTSESASGSITYTVSAVPSTRTLTQISLMPATVNVSPGAVTQFAVAGTWSDGSTTVPAVTYSVTGGSISAGGLYTAGATPGIYHVIATQQGGTKGDTSTVTVTTPTLRALATARGFSIGAAVRDSAFSRDAQYRQTLVTQYNSIVPEDATDFLPIHPGATQYNFAAADALVNFAQANGMAFHGHHLVWHAWIPTWVTTGHTDAQVRAILKDHITTVVSRYRGKAASWDVVNEVIDNQGCFTNQCVLGQSFWLTHLGPEYIDSAFVWAHRADPAATLYINEFRTETIMNKSDTLLALAKRLKARGIPIDGVGFQVHILQQFSPAPTSEQMQANLQRFADAGFDIRITEMDVAIPDNGGATALANQATVYYNILNACLNVSRCRELTTWGFSDRYNWVPKSFPGYGRALPFDSAYQPKPAFNSLLTRLGQR